MALAQRSSFIRAGALTAGLVVNLIGPSNPVLADLTPATTLQATASLPPGTTSYTTPSWKKRANPPHRKPITRPIHEAIRQTAPNPRVQRGSAHGLPAQSPAMPKGPMPNSEPPKTRADRFFNAAAKVMTRSWGQNIFVWLPAISTDPNTGPTIGLMPVLVVSEPQTHHIRQLLAPSYTWNSLFGQTVTGRYYFYPTSESQLYGAASISQRTNRELTFRYENTDADEGVLYLRGEARYMVDASPRFFGIGAASREGDEAGYTERSVLGSGAIGINFLRAWRATVGMHINRLETRSNIIPDTTDIAEAFPNAPGLGIKNTVSNEFRLLWDTRDSSITPTKGATGEILVEKTSQAFGSDADYFHYGVEGRKLFPWKGGKKTTVIHGLFDKANGSFIPFYDLPSVGGRETLRGFGDGRFEDKGRIAFNIEQRFTFANLALMGIETNFELAPFFDLGTVFPDLNGIRSKHFQPVYGGAFRAAVKPNVVGDVELGVGREGLAVFVDINYPY